MRQIPFTDGRQRFSTGLVSCRHALGICGELEDTLERINQFIDALETFSTEEVRMLHEMADALTLETNDDRDYITEIAEQSGLRQRKSH